MLFEILLLIVSTILTIFVSLSKKPHKFPPGPFRWPIFGNLFQVGLEPHKTLMNMKQRYGGIIGIYLGNRRSVFINDHKLLKEAFNLPAFNGKAWGSLAHPKTGEFFGIGMTSGKIWVEQRRFAMSYIQSGFRNNVTMESLVKRETSELVKDLKKICGKPINTQYLFQIYTINALWTIVTGKRYSLHDKELTTLIKYLRPLVSSGASYLPELYPRLSAWFPKLSGLQETRYNLSSIIDFMQDVVDEHKRTYNNEIQRDLVDAYLHKINSTTDQNSSFYGRTGESNLVVSLLDLFSGGTLSVAATVKWTVFLMAHFPDVQKKLMSAIRLHLKQGYGICLQDKSYLPYVEAVIQEVMRYSSLLPLGFFHSTTEDVNFHGYCIPKGTAVFPNQYGIMHDPEVWGDPENFRPERFLNKEETEVIRHEALVPFGIGRRVCPGESFARDELFLFTASIFLNFQVEFEPSSPIPPLKHVNGHALLPVHHRIVFHELKN